MADHFHWRFLCFSKGERCSSAPLDYNGFNTDLCELLVEEALGEYRTIECRQYSSLWRCFSDFCHDVSSCLSQTSKWRKLCFREFLFFHGFEKFSITASKEVQNGTYIRNLQLGFCSLTYSSLRRWRKVTYKFSIRTRGYSYDSENHGNEGMIHSAFVVGVYTLCSYIDFYSQGSKLTKKSSHNFATGYENLAAI